MKKTVDIKFIKKVIKDYEKLAIEYKDNKKLSKQYKEVSDFWRKRYNIERSKESPLAPLFFDKLKIIKTEKRIFK